MESLDMGSLVLVGVAVSLVVQIIKDRLGATRYGTQIAVLALSVLCGGVYVLLNETPYWETFLQILLAAGAFYAFIIRQFENK